MPPTTNADAGATGTVTITFNNLGGGGVTLITGSGQINRSGISGMATALQAVLDSPAGTYFNVHTNNSPSVAIRGQLVRQ